jgi:hypothetical protein
VVFAADADAPEIVEAIPGADKRAFHCTTTHATTNMRNKEMTDIAKEQHNSAQTKN